MMTKTFENISDAAAINFQLLVAQSTLSIIDNGLSTPPFNFLTLPYHLCLVLRRAVLRLACWAPRLRRAAPQVAPSGPDAKKHLRRLQTGHSFVPSEGHAKGSGDGGATLESARQATSSRQAMLRKLTMTTDLDVVQTGEKAERSMYQLREIENYLREGMGARSARAPCSCPGTA